MTDEEPKTVREVRVRAATFAARAGHVFDRTITANAKPFTPAETELNIVAHTGYIYGFALAEVLRRVEERDPEEGARLVGIVNDIAMNGDDGRCADVWPDVEAHLAKGGVGTPQWDARLTDAS